MPYPDALFLDHPEGTRSYQTFQYWAKHSHAIYTRFSVTADNCFAKVYPMFGDLGAGYGSTSLDIPATSNEIQLVTMKCYPRLLHNIKASGITMELPKTIRGMRTNLNQIIKFVDNIGDNIGGFRYEFTF